MGKFLIIISTMLVIFTIVAYKRKNNKKLIYRIKDTFKEINQIYRELFMEKGKVLKEIHVWIFVIAEMFVVMMVIRFGIKNLLGDKTIVSAIFTILGIVITLTTIHLTIGYILLLTSGIQRFIGNVEDKYLKNNLIVSYFILSTYFTVFLFDSSQFEGVYFIALIGLLISYLLNFKVLIKIIKNPRHVKSINEDQSISRGIIIITMLLLAMIILNLFMATCIINQAYPGAFSNNPTSFDLFYYTIITFTTIGYGDIVPVTIPAKVISMLIAFTSVVCITIFLSTVLSYREE